MGITAGKFRTGQKVSITDGRQQIEFDSPADFADWLSDNARLDLSKWQWTTVPVSGGH